MVEGPGQAQAVKRAIHAALVQKVKERKRLTAADYAVLREWEADERAREFQQNPAKPNPIPATDPEGDLEEWVTRDGVVKGQVLSLSQLAQRHQLKQPDAEKLLVKVERKLLVRYGFEGSKKRGPLSGAERQALQWVVSIEQLRRASQEWELETETIRRSRAFGDKADLERLAGIVETVKKLADRRDSLVLKVRELGAKERRIGTGRGQKGVLFAINIGELKD